MMRVQFYAQNYNGWFPVYSNGAEYAWFRILQRQEATERIPFNKKSDFASIGCPDPGLQFFPDDPYYNAYGMIFIYRTNPGYDNWITPYFKIVSKAFDTYTVQFGQNYITGKPFNVDINLRANKSNIAFMGADIETVRDMMGYSLMSVVMEHMTNADCMADPTSIYYANGEGIIPKNAADLFNAVKQDFAHIVENVSSVARLKETVAKLYKSYKARREESEQLDEAKAYAPYFLVIHSLQSYIDLFESNPTLQLNESDSAVQDSGFSSGAGNAANLLDMLQSVSTPSMSLNNSKADSIPFVDAFRELMGRAGQYGIHFIISLDNPEAIRSIRDELYNITYKVFTKGINTTVISQVIGEYGNNAIDNPEIALVAIQGEKYKVRMYRYEDESDAKWYKDLVEKYLELR
jgi:hypothetical protein